MRPDTLTLYLHRADTPTSAYPEQNPSLCIGQILFHK
jgi:hypothetical protein